jgi:hypothetical protein
MCWTKSEEITRMEPTMHQNKNALYQEGLRLARKFLKVNRIPDPLFYTYEEAWSWSTHDDQDKHALRLLRKVADGPLVGTMTGLYSERHIFVNVPVTAWPVQKPQARSWSWPGWKTDRTAMGVVAHELGHYLEDWLQRKDRMTKTDGADWQDIIANKNKQYRSRKKQVSGYEPVPSEAWAESCRLFILNPDLLQKAIPERYKFISKFLKPSETRHWFNVLNNPNYFAAAERWMNA